MGYALGLLTVLVAGVFYGSNYVVVKRYDLKDGFHFQFVFCTAVVVVALVALPVFESFKETNSYMPVYAVNIHLDGALAGAFWTLGNSLTVPIINRVGLGVGLSIWSGISIVVSYFIGRMALFGLQESELSYPMLANLGILLGVFSLISFYKVTKASEKEVVASDIEEPLVDQGESEMKAENGGSKLQGVFLALIAGCCYSVNLIPLNLHMSSLNAQNMTIDPTSESIRFNLSVSLGIFFASVALFLGYLGFAREPVLIDREAWIPCFISGVLWALASFAAGESTAILGLAIGLPLFSNLAFIINNFWSYLKFQEVSGKEPTQWFVTAILLSLVSSLCMALAKA